MKHFILYSILIGIMACGKSHDSNDDCINEMIKEFGMIRYTGQDNWCSSLTLYEFQHKQYFVYDNCTADLYFIPIDCEKNQFCNSGVDFSQEKCELFYQNSKKIGLIGVNL